MRGNLAAAGSEFETVSKVTVSNDEDPTAGLGSHIQLRLWVF